MITIKAVYSSGKIIPEEKARLDRWKKQLHDGDPVEMTFKKYQEGRSERASNYMHALISRYSKTLGLSMIYAKNELCIQRGIAVEYDTTCFTPPKWGGHFVQYWDTTYFRKTTKEYTVKEMGEFIEGILLSCAENQVDVSDLLIEFRDWYDRRKPA